MSETQRESAPEFPGAYAAAEAEHTATKEAARAFTHRCIHRPRRGALPNWGSSSNDGMYAHFLGRHISTAIAVGRADEAVPSINAVRIVFLNPQDQYRAVPFWAIYIVAGRVHADRPDGPLLGPADDDSTVDAVNAGVLRGLLAHPSFSLPTLEERGAAANSAWSP